MKFTHETNPERGRVEHMSSGRRARFAPAWELLAVLGELLGVLGEQ